MRIVVCPDSFKGSLSAGEAAAAIAEGARRAAPTCEIIEIPLADGGEGTVDAFLRARHGRREERTVTDPLGRPVRAAFGILDDEEPTAIVEAAAASGLTLLTPEERDPRLTTSYGTGELIHAALELRVTSVIVGLGGSATNDGGAGALQALGVRFFDAAGSHLTEPLRGCDLGRIAAVDGSALDGFARTMAFTLATDVDNPMTGPRGASMVYGPQKGGSERVCRELDSAMARYAAVLRRSTGVDVSEIAGGGAAGGLGGGLMAAFGAVIASGIHIILDAAAFEVRMRSADLIITGEGSVDLQTLRGKAVMGVVRRVRALSGPPVIAIGGRLEAAAGPALKEAGLSAVIASSPAGMAVDEAMRQARTLVATAAERVVRDFMDRQ